MKSRRPPTFAPECGASALQWFGACPSCGAAGTLSETITEGGSPPGSRTRHDARVVGSPAEGSSASRPASASSTVRSAAGWWRGRWCFSAAIRESASRRCCCRRSARLRTALCMSRVKNRWSRSRCGRGAWASRPAGCASRRNAARARARRAGSRAPRVAVIDSIQTLWSEAPAVGAGIGRAGTRVRGAAHAPRQARRHRALHRRPLTKEGAIAGPRVLEHIVDTVLYFEAIQLRFSPVARGEEPLRRGERARRVRHDGKGLKGVSNPSRLFLADHDKPVPGSCVLATLEGTRPLLVEIRAGRPAHTPTRAGSRSGWRPTGSRCCSPCCTGTRASPLGSRTCS